MKTIRGIFHWLADRQPPSRAWRLLVVTLALSGTICLALWAIEEASQTTSMAAWVRLKGDSAENVHKTLDVYHGVVETGSKTNATVGLASPLSYGAYKTYFDKACPEYESAMRDAADAKAAGSKAFMTPKPRVTTAEDATPKRDPSRDELLEVSLTPIGETEKAWRFEVNGKTVYLPKSQCLKLSETSFKVPRWLVSMKKLTELAAK